MRWWTVWCSKTSALLKNSLARSQSVGRSLGRKTGFCSEGCCWSWNRSVTVKEFWKNVCHFGELFRSNKTSFASSCTFLPTSPRCVTKIFEMSVIHTQIKPFSYKIPVLQEAWVFSRSSCRTSTNQHLHEENFHPPLWLVFHPLSSGQPGIHDLSVWNRNVKTCRKNVANIMEILQKSHAV